MSSPPKKKKNESTRPISDNKKVRKWLVPIILTKICITVPKKWQNRSKDCPDFYYVL